MLRKILASLVVMCGIAVLSVSAQTKKAEAGISIYVPVPGVHVKRRHRGGCWYHRHSGYRHRHCGRGHYHRRKRYRRHCHTRWRNGYRYRRCHRHRYRH